MITRLCHRCQQVLPLTLFRKCSTTKIKDKNCKKCRQKISFYKCRKVRRAKAKVDRKTYKKQLREWGISVGLGEDVPFKYLESIALEIVKNGEAKNG